MLILSAIQVEDMLNEVGFIGQYADRIVYLHR